MINQNVYKRGVLRNVFQFSLQTEPSKIEMFKFFAIVLLFAVVSAQDWRQGVRDTRCPEVNPEFPVLLPGLTCPTFYKCNSGYRCRFFLRLNNSS